MRIFLLPESLAVLLYATGCFLVAARAGRNDLADVAWGPGFVVIALTAYLVAGDPGGRSLLVLLLVTLWGTRLALHIGTRIRGKGEDPRYRAFRVKWGAYPRLGAFLQVFLLQGFLMLLVSLPVVAAIRSPGPPLGRLDLAGAAVWGAGFLFEAAGDRQFAAFLRDPANRGRIMDQGLWRYTRHPNYFGEVLLWWGMYLVALSVPRGWATVAGPLTITALILFVSGIPMAERQMRDNPAYQEYRRRTSVFLPLPPRK